MASILPDISAKHLATPIAPLTTHLDLTLTEQLLDGVRLFMLADTQEQAIALFEHVCQTWHTERGETGGVTWH